MRIRIIFLSCLILLASCKVKTSDDNTAVSKNNEQQFKALPFPEVSVPSMYTDRQDAAEYLASNYWKDFTDKSRNYPSDSLMSSGVLKTDIEQKFADWTAILDFVGYQVAEKAIEGLYADALACEKRDSSSNVLETFADLFQKYFYDPNSPMRNEELYLYFVRNYAEYDGHTLEMRGRYQYETKVCSLNRIGEKAADFRFSDKRGKMRTLYGVESDFTLLFFSNPGCEACMEIINVLSSDEGVSRMIAEKKLAVLNIYIDEDIQSWFSYMPIYPEEWYNGFDPDFVLRSNDLYCIRAIPSLYLLDKDKNVILKDVPEAKLFQILPYLMSI